MLAAAKDQRWEDVIDLGADYQDLVEYLKTLEPLDNQQLDLRRDLLNTILENDANIRKLVTPELERLKYLMGSFKKQRNVLQTYYSTVRPNTAW